MRKPLKREPHLRVHLTFREIAEELKLPERKVEWAFYRGMEKLAKNEQLKSLLQLVASKDYVDLNYVDYRERRRARRNRCRSGKVP